MSSSAATQSCDLVASRSPLSKALVGNLRDRCGIATGARVLVAVSGGPDSVGLAALSAALKRRRSPAELDPVIGHVDHGLREESQDEADLVVDVASQLSLPVLRRRVRVESTGDGIAAAARTARYDALLEMAEEAGATAVLTAHHALDQAETFLLALARGSGLDGLTAMPWTRPLGEDVILARPLLSVGHESLASLVQECGLPSCQDPGNTDVRNPRSMVRHEIIPRLQSMHPGAAQRIAACAEEVAQLLNATLSGEPARRWSTSALRAMAPVDCASALRRAVIALDTSASGCPRSVWKSLAEMVRTETSNSRMVEVTMRVRCVFGADEVRLEEVDDAES